MKPREIHETHEMTEWVTEIRAPAGTPRFYGVRHCEKCGAEEIDHPAGNFMDDELLYPCGGELEEKRRTDANSGEPPENDPYWSGKETMKRMPVIHDPAISEAMKNLFEDDEDD